MSFETKEVKVEQYDDFYLRRPFGNKKNITIDDVLEYFEERCFPRERLDCDELLEGLGLSYYDPIEIVRKTHGLLRDDYEWVRFKGESLKYDDIKIRD